ncbi:MAG TPA: hypothetical protein VK187_06115 [Geobacteraceae bacterium]|nr:hypothetical protein [Geobacteraceae bacterium]
MQAITGKHRAPFYLLFVLTLSITLAACGGGGSSSDSGGGSTGTGLATIEGSVPGTIFMAVNNDTDLEVKRATANATTKTFSMDIPTGTNYRFYVMENENTGNSRVYPMFMGTSNVFELDNTANGQIISLGMVNPDMATGNATPANTPPLMMGRGANPAVPSSLTGSAFSMDTVKGTTWNYNTMMTSGTKSWEHGTLAFDSTGLGNMTGIVRNGSPVSSRVNIPYTMSLSGMLLDPGDTTFQGVVSRDKSVMVSTFTDATGGTAMMIAQKRGVTYQTGDMTGIWRFQRLTAGNDNLSSGWAYGTVTFVSGAASITSITTNNGPGTLGNFTFFMDTNGIITQPPLVDPSFYGVMSMDKSMIVATDTNEGHPEIWVMMRTPDGTTYPMNDMMGDWLMHSVSSGNTGSQDWAFGHSFVDSSGNNTFSQMMGSNGVISPTQMTMTMNSTTGVMTIPGTGGGTGGGMMGGGMMGGGMMTQTFHGIMNETKNMMVSTYSDGTGGYPFTMQVK